MPAFFGFFPDTGALAALLFIRLARMKNRRAATIAAATTGTAMAVFKPGEHGMLLQEFSEAVTAPSVVLLAALLTVLEGLPVILPDASLPEARVRVAKVMAAEPVAATVALTSLELVDFVTLGP